MEKKEYLDELKKELTEKKANNIDETVAKYDKRFDLAKEAGFSEEETIAKFGTPKEVADKEASRPVVQAEVVGDDAPKSFNLNLDVCSDSLTVEFVEGLKETSVDFAGADSNRYTIEKDKDHFSLRYKNRFTGFFKGKDGGAIKVSVPSGLKIDEFKAGVVSGSLNIPLIQANSIFVNSVSGTIDIGDVSAESVNLHNVSGKSHFAKVICSTFYFDTISGNSTIDYGQIKLAKIDSVSGSVSILKGHIGSTKVSALSGKINLPSED